MKTYLKQTPFKTYKYVRRVPKQLFNYVNATSFRVSLGANLHEATQQALEFNNAIEEALQLISLNLSNELILSKLDKLIPKDKEQECQVEAPIRGLFKSAVTEYISSQENNISAEETRDKSYFYKEVCPSVFKHIGITDNPVLKNINYNHLLEFRSIITKLPKRNIQRYRTMEISKLLLNLDKVEDEDKISPRTANKYIKWLRALFNFAIMLNHMQVNLANSIPLQKTLDDKLQRLPLEEEELQILLRSVPQQMQYLLSTLAYTGMRLSELYKTKVTEIEGVKCFSLIDRSIKLKTKSSYRVIPIHSNLLAGIESFAEFRSKISSANLARTTSDAIKRLKFKDMKKKSLYSLRHRFATQLIQKGADTSTVSELMGHSHATMTLSRYSTGYSVNQLKEVVELL